MTAYIVAVGAVGKQSRTLAANVEDTVTFGGGDADPTITNLSHVEVKCRSGAEPLYCRFGPDAAVVGSDWCWEVDPGTSVILPPPTSGDTTVHVISAATAVYSVANGG